MKVSPKCTKIFLLLTVIVTIILVIKNYDRFRPVPPPQPPISPLSDLTSVETAAWIRDLGVRNHLVSSFNVYQLNRNITSPPPYQDPNFLKSCSRPWARHHAFHMLKFWIRLAAVNNITWFLSCASNLGSLRHQDIIPWDHDVDLGVFDVDEATIRQLAVKKRRDMKAKVPNVVTRPGNFCEVNHFPRINCKDQTVMSQTDHCAFCGPVGRVLYRGRFLDLYLLRQRRRNGQIVLEDQSFDKQKLEEMLPISMYFPLRFCKFMGLTVPCVNKRREYAKALYKDLRPLKRCNGITWSTVKRT